MTKEKDILKEIESFYTKLYASVLLDDNDLFDSFVQNFDISKLDDTQRDELEGETTLKKNVGTYFGLSAVGSLQEMMASHGSFITGPGKLLQLCM